MWGSHIWLLISQLSILSACFFQTPSAGSLLCSSGKVQQMRFAQFQQSFKSPAFAVLGDAAIFQWLKALFAKQAVGGNSSGSLACCCWYVA